MQSFLNEYFESPVFLEVNFITSTALEKADLTIVHWQKSSKESKKKYIIPQITMPIKNTESKWFFLSVFSLKTSFQKNIFL